MAKITTSIIGIIIGIIIIIIGFSVQSPANTEEYSIGQNISFGADFYTEIYSVTQDVGVVVRRATKDICNAIGWLIVIIGAIDVCYFIRKICDSDDGYMPSYYPSSTTQSKKDSVKEVVSSAPIPVKPISISDGKWICGHCQAENSSNYGQCKKCGSFRG